MAQVGLEWTLGACICGSCAGCLAAVARHVRMGKTEGVTMSTSSRSREGGVRPARTNSTDSPLRPNQAGIAALDNRGI